MAENFRFFSLSFSMIEVFLVLFLFLFCGQIFLVFQVFLVLFRFFHFLVFFLFCEVFRVWFHFCLKYFFLFLEFLSFYRLPFGRLIQIFLGLVGIVLPWL